VKEIWRATRRQFSAEEKIRIVLEGLRGEDRIAELSRREGIDQKSLLPLVEGVKWPRVAGPFLVAVKLEGRLLVVLYQAAKDSVCC
jgi:hypothetical protein